MKARIRILAALLAAFSLFLVACSPLHAVTEQDDRYLDKQTGIVYRPLSAAYEPISRGAEYATLSMGKVSYTLYEVTGLSPELWLCSSYGDLYLAEDATGFVPFAEWKVSALYLCTNTALSVAQKALRATDADEAAIIDSMQLALTQAAPVYYPSYLTPIDTYIVRFESEDAPGLYYSVKLLRYDEDIYEGVAQKDGSIADVSVGRTFLYDRYADRCVPVESTLFDMLDGVYEKGGAS